MLTSLGADLIAPIPPGERHAESAYGFLDGVLREVLRDLLEGLRTGPVTKANFNDDAGPSLGRPMVSWALVSALATGSKVSPLSARSVVRR